jgi:multisubunit Na+/H+ antiporter MnhC subunit
MPFYRNILKKAWEITWKIRFLWFFGLFAALLGNGGEYEIISRTVGGNAELFPNLKALINTGIFTSEGLRNAGRTAVRDPLGFSVIIGALIIGLALAAFLVWLVIVSQAALVNSSAKLILNKKTDLRDGLQSGKAKFWPVFFLNLANRIIFSGIFILLLLPIVMRFNIPVIAYIFSFVVFVPVSILISFIIKYSIAYAVVKGQRMLEAVANGWLLFRNNWLISVEMSLLLAVINLILGAAAIMALLVLAVPFVFLAAVFLNLGSILGFWLIVFFGLVFFIALLCLTGAALATFQISAWTGLFLELINKGGVSKIARLLSNEK